MPVIKVTNACKDYRSNSELKKVLVNFNMTVVQGSIYALMGSSGCGKTTLISCLVGVMSLDRGLVEIFGEFPSKKNKARIGYMPQDTALIPEFTIREMIWFFGTIFGLHSEKIDERCKFLCDLLELPDQDKLIRNCSGGQQRRVSFALTLIHEPEILILDEPTVGVDPLLRSKIWDYLVEITSTKRVTVLLSTHYIEEARQSTQIGLMRNGRQIAEDSPQNILQVTDTSSLEDAFLKLSLKQDFGNNNNAASGNRVEITRSISRTVTFTEEEKDEQFSFDDECEWNKKARSWGILILKALLVKNLLHIIRNVDVFIITTLMPLVGCICLHYTIGGRIKGLTLGIVNNEVASIDECFNRSLITFQVDGYDCFLNKASCRFINDFDSSFADMKFYKTFDAAFEDAKAGKLVGIIKFTSNFSKSLPLFNDNSDDFSENGEIQVFLDQTDFQKNVLLRRKLYETYEIFNQRLMTDCRRSSRIGSLPIRFESNYGELNFDLRASATPGFILANIFALASYVTATSMIEERVGGIWARTLVAGGSPLHFLLSHMLEGLLILMIQFIEFAVYTVFVFSTSLSAKAALLLSALLLLSGLTGLFFGLLLSVIMSTTLGSLTIGQFFVYPSAFISGAMWPLQGMPKILQIIGCILPFGLPVSAFRAIYFKNATISDPTVYMAFMVLAFWVFVLIFLCVVIITKSEKYKTK